MVFAGSSDRAVYALDAADGRREWVYSVQGWRPTMGGARLASPAVGRAQGRDAVFVAHWVWDKSMAGHQQAGGLTALDALSGRRLWTTALGDNQLSSPIFAREGPEGTGADPRGQPDAGRVFVASENGNLYALDARSGRVLWAHGERDAIKSSPALFTLDGRARLVIGSKFGRVRCLDAATGQVLWRFKAGHWVDGSAAVAEVDGRLVVYVGSYDTNLYALEASSGSFLWSYRTAGGIYSSPAVVREGGEVSVLFASWDHHLHCVSADRGAPRWKKHTGRPIWDSVTLGDSIWSSPSVALFDEQAMVYFGAYSGPFYALPLAAAARELPRPASNLGFWVTLPGVVLATTALTLILTWRHRRRASAGRGR
jgi:outer membrane protein assembly factor BamB